VINGPVAAPTIAWNNLERLAFIVAGAGLLATAVGAAFGVEQVCRSYLSPYLFWLGVALGCLVIVMLHNVTGGVWGLPVRPLLESATHTLPMLALLFVPVVVGAHYVYPWAQGGSNAADDFDLARRWYFSIPIFALRAGLYFAIWCGVQYLLIRRSTKHAASSGAEIDSDGSRAPDNSLANDGWQRRLSAIGLVLYGLTLTLAAVDWIMSLDPDWYSTIFGMQTAASQVLSSIAFVIGALIVLPESEWKSVPAGNAGKHSHFEQLPGSAVGDVLNDLGNLMWAFAMIWGYLAFSQFLIIWSGNLPEEIPWYLRRSTGGWQWFVAVLIASYAVLFLSLVSRLTKRNRARLAAVAVGIFCMTFATQFWTVLPAFHPGRLYVHWLDLTESAGLSGLWLGAFARQMKLRIT
jgi:hypothetical protein